MSVVDDPNLTVSVIEQQNLTVLYMVIDHLNLTVSDGDFELENFPTSSTYRLAKKKQKKVLRL